MRNASLEGYLNLEGYAAAIPLDASRYEWFQHLDHRGRPRSKVRAGRWSFVTSNLDPAHYQQLLALMLSPGALVNASATYGRADGQGTFVTVWGRRCSVCHVFSYFDARGTQGQQPGWTLYFTLAAEEMGREAGSPGSFVMPATRGYAYSGPSTSIDGPVVQTVNKLVSRPLLKNDADPIYDIFGPGRLSHPEEWETTIQALRQEGVRVVFRNGVMAYGPDAQPGLAGQLIIDPEASIGALRHETQHFKDDKQLGFPGSSALLSNPELRWQFEYNAYMQEVRFTRELKAFDTGTRLVANARSEKEYLIKNFGLKNQKRNEK